MQAGLLNALSSLGLTEVEAKVYECLLRDGPSTGYRVAQSIGHAVANTYGALAALQAKGAVIADGGASRHVRAVAADEFLGRLEREFLERRRLAGNLLRDVQGRTPDHRVYRIDRAEQVFERAEAMLRGATYCVLADVFPNVIDRLRGALESAAERSRVVVKTYGPATLRGANIVAAHETECRLIGSWLGQHLHLVVDARECLLALLDAELRTVRQAIWTGCPFVTSAHHVGLQFEFMYTSAWTSSDGDVSAALTRVARTGLFADTGVSRTPGYGEFANMVGVQSVSKGADDPPRSRGARRLRKARKPRLRK